MVNYVSFIPLALAVFLCLSFLEIHNLKKERQTLENETRVLSKDLGKTREANYILEQRLKKGATVAGEWELRWRQCNKENGDRKIKLDSATSQLQSKVVEYQELEKHYTEAKETLEAKKKETEGAVKEAKKYHDLFEAGNAKVDEIRHAYVELQKLLEEEQAKVAALMARDSKGGPKANNEDVVRREAAAGATAAVKDQSKQGSAQKEAEKPVEQPEHKQEEQTSNIHEQQLQEEAKREAAQEAENKEPEENVRNLDPEEAEDREVEIQRARREEAGAEEEEDGEVEEDDEIVRAKRSVIGER